MLNVNEVLFKGADKFVNLTPVLEYMPQLWRPLQYIYMDWDVYTVISIFHPAQEMIFFKCFYLPRYTTDYMIMLQYNTDIVHCISKLSIICSHNGLPPGQRQAVIWTNVGILLIGPLGTNFNETLIKIHIFAFKKIHFEMLSGKWQPVLSGPQCVNIAVDNEIWQWINAIYNIRGLSY